MSFSEDECTKRQKPTALQQQRGLDPSGNDGREPAIWSRSSVKPIWPVQAGCCRSTLDRKTLASFESGHSGDSGLRTSEGELQSFEDRDVKLIDKATFSGRGRRVAQGALCVRDIGQKKTDASERDCLMSRRLFVDIVEHRAISDDRSGWRSFFLLLRDEVRPIRFVVRAFIKLALALLKRLD